MALSALHLVHGLLPSHLDFFSLHLSQALHTRFRKASAESWDDVLIGPDMVLIGYGLQTVRDGGWCYIFPCYSNSIASVDTLLVELCSFPTRSWRDADLQ